MTSASGEGAVQLRASGERAVLVGHDGVAEREMDPRRLPLGGELTEALHEWAKVANAIRRATAADDPANDPAAGSANSTIDRSAIADAVAADAAPGSAADSANSTIDRSAAGPADPAGPAGEVAAGSVTGGAAGSADSTNDRSDMAGPAAAGTVAGPDSTNDRSVEACVAATGTVADLANSTNDRSAGGSAAEAAAGGSAAANVAAGSAAGPVGGSAAGAVVSRRGLQLAARVAAALGVTVDYVDPLTGETVVVEPPQSARRLRRPAEPVPWLTGLTVTAASLLLVTFTVVTLAVTLAESYPLLALAANVVVTAGLVPSLWLIHREPVWRWVAFGAAGGIALGWLALPFILV